MPRVRPVKTEDRAEARRDRLRGKRRADNETWSHAPMEGVEDSRTKAKLETRKMEEMADRMEREIEDFYREADRKRWEKARPEDDLFFGSGSDDDILGPFTPPHVIEQRLRGEEFRRDTERKRDKTRAGREAENDPTASGASASGNAHDRYTPGKAKDRQREVEAREKEAFLQGVIGQSSEWWRVRQAEVAAAAAAGKSNTGVDPEVVPSSAAEWEAATGGVEPSSETAWRAAHGGVEPSSETAWRAAMEKARKKFHETREAQFDDDSDSEEEAQREAAKLQKLRKRREEQEKLAENRRRFEAAQAEIRRKEEEARRRQAEDLARMRRAAEEAQRKRNLEEQARRMRHEMEESIRRAREQEERMRKAAEQAERMRRAAEQAERDWRASHEFNHGNWYRQQRQQQQQQPPRHQHGWSQPQPGAYTSYSYFVYDDNAPPPPRPHFFGYAPQPNPSPFRAARPSPVRPTAAQIEASIRAGWDAYETRWAALPTLPSTPAWTFGTIPWPVATAPSSPAGLTPEKMRQFFLAKCHSEDKSRKERVRAALLRWHPDKFNGKYLGKVREEDKEAVMEGVRAVVHLLQDLQAER